MAKTNLITPPPATLTYIYNLKPVDAPDLAKRSPGSVTLLEVDVAYARGRAGSVAERSGGGRKT